MNFIDTDSIYFWNYFYNYFWIDIFCSNAIDFLDVALYGSWLCVLSFGCRCWYCTLCCTHLFFSFLKSFHVVWDFVLTESDFRFFWLFFVLSNLWCKFLRNRYSDRDDNPLLKGAFWVAKYLINSVLWYFFFLSLPFLGRSNFLHRF